ncbi:alpha-2-macroglobulin family protein [Ichthyenterobacterium sp. W332]|uniref:Alpha-2-macroglobulin family protein n=1 Tax=Microcosmobacter mediterraneus TaxID=3075607 RepID=A0ABU2YKR1_9FLAO|nr:alpha-2-macroglobulin family protein [Ichthyenterobacterium sp. W332]MDT0558407.1 alpha-2-macroglobulin family protein [Ichthyenterobacterium sp. W332]
MKQTLSILMVFLFASFSHAQNDYKSLWETVEKHENDGLPKSALKVVESIAEQAKKDLNKPQQIKVLLYKSKYVLTLEEDAQLKIINDFKAEIKINEAPVSNILENMLATMYWQYFQQNRYRFYNRSNTQTKVDKADFRTWDLKTLFQEIKIYYQKSLENGLLLKQERLVDYDILLHKATESKRYRPTLYDLLAHNALEFYKTDENSITKPTYQFKIDDLKYLGDNKTFQSLNINSRDSSSLQLEALKLYQKLIKFHAKDTEFYALADVDIQRLKFVAQHATFGSKEDHHLKALTSGSNLYKNSEISSWYNFEIASIYAEEGRTYNTKKEDTWNNRWKLKEALKICNTVIERHPSSRGSENCRTLKNLLLIETLQLTTEKYVPLNKHSRLLVSYTNINKLKFELFKVSINQLEEFNSLRKKDDKLKFLKSKSAVKDWEETLKNESDYQNHFTEIVIPKLDNGIYIILAKTNNNQNIFAVSELHVTNMALVEKAENKKHVYQLINRNDGSPISGATINMQYKINYNSSSKTRAYTTDSKGQFTVSKPNASRYYQIKFDANYNEEKGFFNNFNMYRSYRDRDDNDTKHNGFLFTDRSIYRPGQTVFFKGIVMSTKDEKSSVVNNETVTVQLKNVNHEQLKELTFKTNAFGSFHGEFILPNDGLTGEFHLQVRGRKDLNVYHYFSVEEYKRPKFETKFNPVTKLYKVNDSVTVKGNALAYAGSAITDAKVVYRVTRKVQYPNWYYWRRPYFSSQPQEITFGESITDDSGNFEITFKALPDDTVDKTSLPIFQYEVTADVTDINGETRSATTIVNVGYHAMTASISVDPQLDKTKKNNTLTIETKNLNGEVVEAKGTLKIYKLQAPKTVLRNRPWQAPDYQELSQSEFKTLFPHDAYNNESNPQFWKKGDLFFETSFDTETSREIALGKLKKWQSGLYTIILESEDNFGQAVKAESRTTLYSTDDNTLADNALFNITTNKNSYTIGETVSVTIGSSATTTVTLEVEKDQKVISSYIIPLNNNKKTITIPVTEADFGGFVVHYSFSAFNGYQSGSKFITVPYPKTNLEIETTTFRDKLQPGTDETWSFKIKGPKGEQVSAELLASMYDASLDQFKTHQWQFNPIQRPTYYSTSRWNANHSFGNKNFRVYNTINAYYNFKQQSYDQLNWFGFYFGNIYELKDNYYRGSVLSKNRSLNEEDLPNAEFVQTLSGQVAGLNITSDSGQPGGNSSVQLRGVSSINGNSEPLFIIDGVSVDEKTFKALSKDEVKEIKVLKDSKALAIYGIKGKNGVIIITTVNGNFKVANFDNIKIRKNLQETAFFFPQLQTDAEGHVSFNFTTPEALTQWKLQLLAHTKTLESATTTLEAVTQKELMVIPNTPRFLRQGDQITISTKIANLTDKELKGVAILQLFDAITGESIDHKLSNSYNDLGFSVSAKGNTNVVWNLDIPNSINAVQYKIIAKSGDFSDGEQNALPVLSNRMLVTETLPMWIRSNETRTFTLDKLKTNTSTTLKHHKLTLEMTSNPAWYAVQALPYLMEYPYDCNEQTFSRYYANALASHVANSNPRLQEVFNQWRNTDALISNLEKNEELKSILIQETPWLRDAQSETEQKKRIGLLFDLNKMNSELSKALRKLKQNQMNNGAWPWFKGGYANRYITQHIITGFGHLKQLSVIQSDSEESMIKKAIQYLDNEFVKEYHNLKKYNKNVDLSKDHLSYTQLHYLYMRSFFKDIKVSEEVQDIMDYYHNQVKDYWLSRSLYAKGLMTLITHRNKDTSTATKILKSLKETSINSEELGMYWKANTASWYWYQAPIETQALLIEAFAEAGTVIQNEAKNLETIDNLKIWLLKNKQTSRWKTTKATTEAVYALLLQGSDWLSVSEAVEVLIGERNIVPEKLENVTVEAGTGYYKTSWNANEITPEMANVTLTKKGNGIAWGSLYWQYFEDLDNITSADTPLSLKKKLFLKKNTDTGEQITEVTTETNLEVGDLVRVRIELQSDRDMEFLHMKDMRAAGLEPVNVLSKYKWQDGLGYYESTKDASTNFFFDRLPKGVYVFEYDLRVNNAGNMSNGITTIQSMYAPEFSSHSEGVRISVK